MHVQPCLLWVFARCRKDNVLDHRKMELLAPFDLARILGSQGSSTTMCRTPRVSRDSSAWVKAVLLVRQSHDDPALHPALEGVLLAAVPTPAHGLGYLRA